jgi:hypothetical protein
MPELAGTMDELRSPKKTPKKTGATNYFIAPDPLIHTGEKQLCSKKMSPRVLVLPA